MKKREVRKEVLQVRVEKSTKTLVELKAEQEGKSVSTYIKALIDADLVALKSECKGFEEWLCYEDGLDFFEAFLESRNSFFPLPYAEEDEVKDFALYYEETVVGKGRVQEYEAVFSYRGRLYLVEEQSGCVEYACETTKKSISEALEYFELKRRCERGEGY